MLQRAVLPDLRRRAAASTAVIASRVLRTWGESESGLNERLDDVIARLDVAGDPTLAFLASGWEGLKVRLTRRRPRRRRGARPRSTQWEAEIRERPRRRSCSASTTTRWSRWCSTCCRARGLTLAPRRVGHRRAGRRPA